MKLIVLTVAALALASGMGKARAASGGAEYGAWGVDLAAMDRSVKPGNDFFRYVNGAWYDKAVVKPDQSRTGVMWTLQQVGDVRLKRIVASLAARPYAQLDADAKKLRDLYDAFLDVAAIEAAGLTPVKRDLDSIAGMTTLEDVARAMGRPGLGLSGPFGLGIGVDRKDPNRYAVSLHQSGLGLSRDYYLKDDKALAAVRAAYKKHLARMFALAGMADGERRAEAVFDLEYKFAQAHWSNVENRDATRTYNPMPFSRLKTLAPQFPWNAFFEASEIPLTGPQGERQVIVAQVSAIPKLAQIFATTPMNVWHDYLTVHYLGSRAAYLPKAFDEETFAFYGTVLSGQPRQRPREIRALHVLSGNMGEALGKLYVAEYFPPAAEAKAVALVNNLLKTYDADIRTLTWMTPPTRDKALEKLHRMSVKIGYPSRWRDYSALVIDPHDLLGNIERSHLLEERRDLARLDQPVDRTEWGYPPQTVNASYNPTRNEIVFPAAILQPPFFDPRADDAVNYGGIGYVIGHEISHGFDDQGSRYDASGALNEWWTPADRQAFEAKTKVLVAQYGAYEPLPGFHVNGALTLGENIADNAGTAVALKAYHLSLGGKPAPVLDGFTGDQRFYLSLAQVNRDKRREDSARQQVLADVHAPSAFRAIGVTRNQDEWYAAFGVKPGETYYLPPDKRVHIW